MNRLVAGCMSGTSLDAIDASLVRIDGEGLAMRVTPLRSASYPLGSLATLLRPIASQKRCTAGEIARAAFMLGMAHMVLLKQLIGKDKADLVAVHGQTIYHECGVSFQLMNVHPIVQELRTPVIFDMRGADLSAGGQGAPITPLADHVLFRDSKETRAVVNLGGFSNFTWLAPSRQRGAAALRSIRGGDICACNQILDTIARKLFKTKYDKGGQRALAGTVDKKAAAYLERLLAFQARGGRSLGTGDETLDWVKLYATRCSGEDLARTACSVIGKTIVRTIGEPDRVILAGGSALNAALVAEIATHAGVPIVPSDSLGVPVQFREAICMAVLGALAADKVPITLPQVTGREDAGPVGGCWAYPTPA
jgi:anhydro-N-acetylmuramic acid kinase